MLEIRCPACVELGWYTSRVLFYVVNKIIPCETRIQITCWKCKSIVSWKIGDDKPDIIKKGQYYHKKQTAAFE